jgi:hypothetical protein
MLHRKYAKLYAEQQINSYGVIQWSLLHESIKGVQLESKKIETNLGTTDFKETKHSCKRKRSLNSIITLAKILKSFYNLNNYIIPNYY